MGSSKKREQFFVLVIKDVKLFDAIRRAEEAFLCQCEIKDLVKFILVEFKNHKYIEKWDKKPRSDSNLFYSNTEQQLINRMLCWERPDLCEDENLVNSRCSHPNTGCDPSFDYSTGQSREAEGFATL